MRGKPRISAMRRPGGPGALLPPHLPAGALLDATVSVPWERPVHEARLAWLTRTAHPGQLSVHVACGTDRLGFIDAACGLRTVLTDIDATSLALLAEQWADLQARFGPLGSVQFRRLAIEALASEAGFTPGSVHHVTLQNLFNAQVHSPQARPRLIDTLLTLIAEGGTCFCTESEAAMLQVRARIQGIWLAQLGRIPGYYDEDVLILQVRAGSRPLPA